jgi:hypothetical protein
MFALRFVLRSALRGNYATKHAECLAIAVGLLQNGAILCENEFEFENVQISFFSKALAVGLWSNWNIPAYTLTTPTGKRELVFHI